MKAFNIPNITESLKKDYRDGKISIEDVAIELHDANLTPYIDIERAIKVAGIKKPYYIAYLKHVEKSGVKETNRGFSAWIQSKHKIFRDLNAMTGREKNYAQKFTKWLNHESNTEKSFRPA